MGAHTLRGHDRFILDCLAFELSDAGQRAGLTGRAVINDGFDGFGG